jgi:hypothetical protein
MEKLWVFSDFKAQGKETFQALQMASTKKADNEPVGAQ